jgi:hypothetical protein
MKDTMKIMGDLVSPATEESDWEVLAETPAPLTPSIK